MHMLHSLLLLAGTAHAVSLASFTPRIDNLPTQCNAAYRTKISGCTGEDFLPGATCSAACVQGLKEVGEIVVKGCVDVDVGETSIVALFQLGVGIIALCPPEETTTTTTTSKTSTKGTSTQTAVTRTSTSARTSSSTVPTEEAKPSSTLSGLITDPNVATSFTTSISFAPTQSSSATPSETPKDQLSNTHSGGGSPFDVVAVGSSTWLRDIDTTMAVLLATAVVFAVCC